MRANPRLGDRFRAAKLRTHADPRLSPRQKFPTCSAAEVAGKMWLRKNRLPVSSGSTTDNSWPYGTCAIPHRFRWVGENVGGIAMKWMLVVFVSGVTPVSTNLVFDKFSECLAAEEQMRQHYIDAFEAWDRSAAVNADRRRDYRRARDMQARRMLGNVGTCIPHADGNQPQIVTPQQPVTPQTSQPTPQPSPRT